MSEPTTDDMVAWLTALAAKCEAAYLVGRLPGVPMRLEWRAPDDAREDGQMLRAIAARLRQSTGKAEPPPTFDAER